MRNRAAPVDLGAASEGDAAPPEGGAREEEAREQRPKANGNIILRILRILRPEDSRRAFAAAAFILCAYVLPEPMRWAWDRRWMLSKFTTIVVLISLELVVVASLLLFKLRSRDRKLYGCIEVAAAAFATATTSATTAATTLLRLISSQIFDSSNAVTTIASLGSAMHFFIRGFDNYTHGAPKPADDRFASIVKWVRTPFDGCDRKPSDGSIRG
jgi:hypothetical protein